MALRISKIGLLSLLPLLVMTGCATSTPTGQPVAPPAASQDADQPVVQVMHHHEAPVQPTADLLEQDEKFGLHFESLRVSGAGLLLDFRVRVTDPEKARKILNRKTHPRLIDPVSKMEMQVPHAENVGSLRHTGGKLIKGRVYTMLFANPGRTVKSGAQVNIVMGDFRMDHVAVE